MDVHVVTLNDKVHVIEISNSMVLSKSTALIQIVVLNKKVHDAKFHKSIHVSVLLTYFCMIKIL